MGENLTPLLKPSLENSFRTAWADCRVLLFSAPCGSGKTTTAAALLRGRNCRTFCTDEPILPEAVPPKCEAVVVDDIHAMTEPVHQQELCTLIRLRPDLHFVLLSRGRIPGWLVPFQLAGILQTFETEDLLFDLETSHRMLESRGAEAGPAEMSEIHRDIRGYPVVLELLCRLMAGGRAYGPDLLAAVKHDLFSYFDEAVYYRFEPPMRMFLMCIAPFEHFQREQVRMVSTEERADDLLASLLNDTTMLVFDGPDSYHLRPIFREFLMWKFGQNLTGADRAGIYRRAALFFELHGRFAESLECYSRAGDEDRVSALLVKNAELHPGVGHYYEMMDYYFALPEDEIGRSPALMCAMSMLTAMTMDYETSEKWYQRLAAYASGLRKNDPEYRDARGKLAYLDIGLPQRGSKSLIRVIDGVFRVMLDRQLKVPAFSVTSTLPSVMNGGKDFCKWSKKDDLLYAAMRSPVEAVLGRDGVGLADCAICESKFEKGENVSEQMLTLMARLGEIQTRGTPDIEFAVLGLLARIQVSQGRAETALQSIESLREKYEKTGETRFLGNVDALLTRIRLRLGDENAARLWLETAAPKNDARLWAMWRYRYMTRVMVQLSEGESDEPLLLLARLAPYCSACGRMMDGLHIHILTALCRERQGSALWKPELGAALDTALEYRFVWPVAQYGAAVLPLLRECGWEKDPAFLQKLEEAAQQQAVFYPRFLKPGARLVNVLSATEMQVLRLLCRSLSNQEIGEILDIRLATVKTHVSHILQKLNVQNRSEASQAAQALHLL